MEMTMLSEYEPDPEMPLEPIEEYEAGEKLIRYPIGVLQLECERCRKTYYDLEGKENPCPYCGGLEVTRNFKEIAYIFELNRETGVLDATW